MYDRFSPGNYKIPADILFLLEYNRETFKNDPRFFL